MSVFLAHVNYVVAALIMAAGLFVIVISKNRVKQLVGLGVFQTSVLLFYVSLGYVRGGKVPIISDVEGVVYVNPLPSVLMLTAIVVGVATTAVGYAMIMRIENKS